MYIFQTVKLYNERMHNNIRTNVIVNIVRTVVLTFLSFITFPWVCRYLGDAQVCVYTGCHTFVAYFLILAKIGIPNLAVRECVKVRDNKELLSNKVQGFFLLQMICTIISFGLMTAVVFSVPALRETSSLIFILSINFLAGAFSFEWIFIALEKQFYMSVRSIISLTLSAILIIAFVSTPDDVYIYALIAVAVTFTTTIANLYYVRRYVSFKKTMPYDLKQYAKPLFVLCTLSLTLSLYNQTDTFILGFINPSKTEVASYSVGIKGVDIIIGIITALSTVFIPRAAFYYGKEDKRFFNNLNKYSMNICMFIVIPAIVTMAIMSKSICGLIAGVNYEEATTSYASSPMVLIILSSMMLTYSFGDIIYGQILLPMKKEKYYLFSMLIGTIVNAVLSIVLGKYVFASNPAVGVALGTVITDVSIIIFLLAVTWKWTSKAIFNKNTLKLLVANIIVAAVTVLLYFVALPPLWNSLNVGFMLRYALNLVIVVLVDAIIYIVSCIVMKEDLVYSFIRHRRGEVKEDA